MKELLDKLPITTIAIIYFFVCGGLYIIGFWTTFDIDITSFISLTDIPKSFVFPLVLGAGFTLLNTILSSITTKYRKDRLEEPIIEEIPKTPRQRFLKQLVSLDSLILLTFVIAFSFITFDKLNSGYWFFFGFSIATLLVFKFTGSSIIKKYLPSHYLRLHISHVVVLIPIACFVIGKSQSLRIYNNDKPLIYKDSRKEINTKDTEKLKLIGFIGDKVILSTLDNKKIVFVNQSSRDEFVIVKE